MKHFEIIQKIKDYTRGIDILSGSNSPILESITRDKVLYGETDVECTGIVTTCYPSVKVIEKAHELNANLIISHESLFWNHGDHTDWLEDTKNATYLKKKALLEEYGITVWRCHDYIHSGIPDGKGGWADGIFFGFLEESGLIDYYVPSLTGPVQYSVPFILNFKGKKLKDIYAQICERTHLNGLRYIGDPEAEIHRGAVIMHVLGPDNDKITYVDQKNIELVIAMELIDFTLSIYMRDSIEAGFNKAVITAGHFNLEEPGMKYMLKWIHEAMGTSEIPVPFVPSGDVIHYYSTEN